MRVALNWSYETHFEAIENKFVVFGRLSSNPVYSRPIALGSWNGYGSGHRYRGDCHRYSFASRFWLGLARGWNENRCSWNFRKSDQWQFQCNGSTQYGLHDLSASLRDLDHRYWRGQSNNCGGFICFFSSGRSERFDWRWRNAIALDRCYARSSTHHSSRGILHRHLHCQRRLLSEDLL